MFELMVLMSIPSSDQCSLCHVSCENQCWLWIVIFLVKEVVLFYMLGFLINEHLLISGLKESLSSSMIIGC